MQLMDLKKMLLDGRSPSGMLVFVCPDGYFLAEQYVDAICQARNSVRRRISGLSELDSALALVLDYHESVNVLRTAVFDDFRQDYSEFGDVVVLCEKIDKKVEKALGESVVKMPKILDWQALEYAKTTCPGVADGDLEWLYAAKGKDIDAFDCELDKLRQFREEERAEAFNKMRYDRNSYLFAPDVFALSNAILDRKHDVVMDALAHCDSIGIEPLALASMLLRSAKNMLLSAYDSGKTAEEIGISPKQYGYYKKSKPISQERLQKMIAFLSDIDRKLKNGLLDMPKEKQLEYVIINSI